MKYLKIIYLVLFLAFISFRIARYFAMSKGYSPIDNYIQSTIKIDSLNNAAKLDAQNFIDSLNNN